MNLSGMTPEALRQLGHELQELVYHQERVVQRAEEAEAKAQFDLIHVRKIRALLKQMYDEVAERYAQLQVIDDADVPF